ncbi:MAG: DUF1256 domain-containing protein [Clostridia bacterium]|nr:DUF1256 domain-containing protein [Clostridia bacterium]
MQVKNKNIWEINAKENGAAMLINCAINNALKTPDKDVVFLCVGTETVECDKLGVEVGNKIKSMSKYHVYGSNGKNIDACNYLAAVDFIDKMHGDSFIIAVDSAVGKPEQIGCVQVSEGGLRPGLAVGREFESIGDVGVIGIITDKRSDFCKNDKKHTDIVKEIAEVITKAVEIGIGERFEMF